MSVSAILAVLTFGAMLVTWFMQNPIAIRVGTAVTMLLALLTILALAFLGPL